MLYYSTLLILMICNPIVSGVKVIERFGGFYRKDLPCKLWIPEGMDKFEGMSSSSPLNLNELIDSVKKLNCTFIRSKGDDFGYPMENGSYTGLIGMVQRQESDVMLVAVRPDSLPYEPALIGPMVLEADAAIISGKSKKNRVTREILEFVSDVDPLVYAYFGISIIVFSVCYTLSIVLSKAIETDDWDALTIGKDFFKTIWESCAAVLDEEQFSPDQLQQQDLDLVLYFGSVLRNLWHVPKQRRC